MDDITTTKGGLKMSVKEGVISFITVFVLTVVTTAVVTYLWNLIADGVGVVDWETVFRTAVVLGIVLTWIEIREKAK